MTRPRTQTIVLTLLALVSGAVALTYASVTADPDGEPQGAHAPVVAKRAQSVPAGGETVRLRPASAMLRLSDQVSPDMRAVTIGTDHIPGLSELLRPDDRVDVIATLPGKTGPSARTILQNAKLIAVADSMPAVRTALQAKNGSAARLAESTSVTLEVSPGDAEKLAFADAGGKLKVVLRGRGASSAQTDAADGRAAVARTSRQIEQGRVSYSRGMSAGAIGKLPPLPLSIEPIPTPAVTEPVQEPAVPAAKSIEVIKGNRIENATVPE